MHFLKSLFTGTVESIHFPSFVDSFLFGLHVLHMQFISCTYIASELLILNKPLCEEKNPVVLWILYFLPPIAIPRRSILLHTSPVLPYQNTFTNSQYSFSYLSPATSSSPLHPYLLPLHLHHWLGKIKAASIISGSSVCTRQYNACVEAACTCTLRS